jgi:hypothetical protein
MSKLIRVGKLGQVYLGWRNEDGKAPLDVWRSGGEWHFTCRALHVIVSPLSVGRRLELRRNGAELRVV